jgi:hypothetical protein
LQRKPITGPRAAGAVRAGKVDAAADRDRIRGDGADEIGGRGKRPVISADREDIADRQGIGAEIAADEQTVRGRERSRGKITQAVVTRPACDDRVEVKQPVIRRIDVAEIQQRGVPAGRVKSLPSVRRPTFSSSRVSRARSKVVPAPLTPLSWKVSEVRMNSAVEIRLPGAPLRKSPVIGSSHNRRSNCR